MSWIGVDLDGTLAKKDDSFYRNFGIGAPVPLMLERVRQWVGEGKEVRIMTARVSSMCPTREEERLRIETWLIEHLGCTLPITAEKDYHMVELWDDLAIQVTPNTGIRADGKW